MTVSHRNPRLKTHSKAPCLPSYPYDKMMVISRPFLEKVGTFPPGLQLGPPLRGASAPRSNGCAPPTSEQRPHRFAQRVLGTSCHSAGGNHAAGHMHGSVPSPCCDWIVQRGQRVHAREKLGRALEGPWAALRETPACSRQRLTTISTIPCSSRVPNLTARSEGGRAPQVRTPPWPAQCQSWASPDTRLVTRTLPI